MHVLEPLRRVAIAAAFSAAGATALPALAGPTHVPFKASAATQETLGFDANCAPSLLGGTTKGSGTASHLGAIKFLATDCITPGQTPASSFSFSNGRLTITAANGDQLFASYSGTLTPIPNTAPFSLYSIDGNFTVTGGTGRFTNASGSGYIQGTEDIRNGEGQFDLTGTISY